MGEQVNETAAPPSAQIDHQQSEPPFPFFAHEKFKPVTVSAPAIEARSTVAVTVPESESELPRHDAGEVAAVTQVRIDNPTVDKVSDGLVDIAVHATLILKRLQRGDLDPQELEELSRKVRARAIETRRITNQMLRAEQVESPQKAD